MSTPQTRSFLTRANAVAFALLCAALSFCASILSAEEYDLNPGQTLTLGTELSNTANTVNVKGGTLKVDGATDITANFNYDETSVLTLDLNNSSSNKWITPMSQSLLSSDSRDIYFINSGNTSAYLHLGTSYEYDRMDYSAYTGTYIAKDGAIVHIEYADHNIDVNLRMESGTTLVIPYKSSIYAYRTSNKSIELDNATIQYGSYGDLVANGLNFSGDCILQCTGTKETDWYRLNSSNSNDANSFTGSGTITLLGPGYLAINAAHAATKYTGDFIIGTSSTRGKLSLEADNILNANTTIKSINGTVDWGAKSQSFKALEYQSGTMDRMTGTLTIGSEFKYDSSTNLTVDSVIAGSGKVTKNGSGTLTLSQSNTYTGGTSITEGTLSAGNVGAVGTGPLTVENATFSVVSGTVSAGSVKFTGDCTFDSSSGWNLLKSISGSGTLTLTGSGYLAVKDGYTATNYDGVIIVGTAAKAGKLSFEGNNAINTTAGVVKVVNGTVDWRQKAESFKSFEYYSGTMVDMTGTLTLSSEFLYDSSTNLTVPCVIAGAAKLTKKGSGTLTLSAENTYSGATSITGGTLVATTLKAVGPGPLTIDNGTLSIVQDIVPSSSVTITGDSTFNSSSGWNLVKNFSGSGTLTLTGSGYLAFKDGYSATGYEGDFFIGTAEKVGKISFESDNTINAGSSVKVVNGTVDWRQKTETFKSFEFYGGAGMANANGAVMILSDEFIYDSSTPLTVGVVIDGAASLTKNGDGTLSLSASNTYTGGTTISTGTLALTGSAGSLGSGDVTVGENATLEINYDNASTTATLPPLSMAEGSSLKVTSGKVEFSDDDVTLNNLSGENGTVNVNNALTLNNDKKTKYSGSISAQSITKTGDETLQLYAAAANMIDASSFVVSSGRLDMQKYFTGDLQINSGAAFSPGNSVGTLEQTGNFTLDAGATLLMELGGTDVDENDQLIVNGNLNLTDGSVIELVLSDNSSLKGGDTFTAILHANNSADLADDFIDNYVRSYYFTGLEYSPMGDGTYAITGYLDPNAVPEPSTWALLALGAAGLLYWRKRKN